MRLAPVVIVMMLACLAAPAASAAASAEEPCVPPGADVHVDNGRAVVYVDRRGDVVGCLRSRPRRVVLTDNSVYTGWVATVAGRFAAVAIDVCNSQGCSPDRLVVFDLRSGRRAFRAVFTDASWPLEGLVNVELRATGVVAFSGVSTRFGQGWIWLGRPGERRRLLDHGPEVDPYSLRRVENTVVWNHGTEARSVPLR